MSNDPRIEQFKRMTEADPDNELGHFSLGKACFDAGQFDEAINPLTRALELNASLSKAHQLLAEAYDKTGRRDRAIESATRGVTVADEQGDRMPRDAMVKRLEQWGAPVPALQHAEKTAGSAGDAGPSRAGFSCARCRKPTGQLEKPPFKGALGQKIFDNVCTACWREWIPMGTKVINELGLVLSSPASQSSYDQYMIEFLQLEDR